MKPSYSIEGPNGSYTEWPRIRQVGAGLYLSFMNGGLFDFPAQFSPTHTGGLRPICSLLRTITDWDTLRNELVFSIQETSVHGIQVLNALVPGQPQSNLLFTSLDKLPTKGPAIGWGGVWVGDAVAANVPSEALHIGGYTYRTLHLNQKGNKPANFTIEIDRNGTGQWSKWETVQMEPNGYVAKQLPTDLTGEWIRLVSDQPGEATAYLHGWSRRPTISGEFAIFAGISPIGSAQAGEQTIVRPGFPTKNLQVLTTDKTGKQTYFEVDETLTFKPTTDTAAVNLLNRTHQLTVDFTEDAASIVVKRFDGKAYRLPKGDAAFSQHITRGIREVVQERYLANLHGTFYEIPRYGRGPKPYVYMPDFIRMKPVVSHRLAIQDFMTWRGLLVLSGLSASSGADGHVFRSPDGKTGLWFGEIDDLWKLGKPTGVGGPWKNTFVKGYEQASDPYLMTGYDQKTLQLSHSGKGDIQFMVEVDFLANDTWHEYRKIDVPAGKTVLYEFPTGFSAHWVRFRVSESCEATAQLIYK